tara:strand:+ start:53 stop:580 length:528 start_codon:yes stop_codon:yes gene_type:complete
MQNTILFNSVHSVLKKSDHGNLVNERIYTRNVPSATLQPSFSIRPVQTKYTLFSLDSKRTPADVPIIKEPAYNVETVFNPGNAQAPWSGFATKINTESKLRNQYFALQKSEQAVYVPSSTSDLYNDPTIDSSMIVKDTFPYLNHTDQFDSHNPNTIQVGLDTFHNCTRQQLKTRM